MKLGLSMMLDLMGDLRDRAQDEAIRVFARNLKALLLAAPAGRGPDGDRSGFGTGLKVAVVDATGKLLATARSIRSSRRTTCGARRRPWAR